MPLLYLLHNFKKEKSNESLVILSQPAAKYVNSGIDENRYSGDDDYSSIVCRSALRCN